jgi:hypothetical protein
MFLKDLRIDLKIVQCIDYSDDVFKLAGLSEGATVNIGGKEVLLGFVVNICAIPLPQKQFFPQPRLAKLKTLLWTISITSVAVWDGHGRFLLRPCK